MALVLNTDAPKTAPLVLSLHDLKIGEVVVDTPSTESIPAHEKQKEEYENDNDIETKLEYVSPPTWQYLLGLH